MLQLNLQRKVESEFDVTVLLIGMLTNLERGKRREVGQQPAAAAGPGLEGCLLRYGKTHSRPRPSQVFFKNVN